jgi:hypothetical protein
MAKQTVAVGTTANDGTGDPARTAFQKINANFDELYARPTFRVHKNGTNQTGVAYNAFTKLTWSTEAFDVGNLFGSDKWTPPAGKVLLSAAAHFVANANDCPTIITAIYKNGTELARSRCDRPSNREVHLPLTFIDDANGTDYYEVYVFHLETGGGSATISGGTGSTFFCGHVI